MLLIYILSFILGLNDSASTSEKLSNDLIGSWQTTFDDGSTVTSIVTANHFSVATYFTNPAKYISTSGGSWSATSENNIELTWEFHTNSKEKVGTKESINISVNGNSATMGDIVWKRIDDGSPGKLQSAWLITGRKRKGEISTMTPGARRTMKILSGTRFQWIAYNVETKEFFGTGGGTYTTKNGKYTENIDFFSRDNTRVGATLEFDYELKDKQWHHRGKSSKGTPLFEIWTTRKQLSM